jgi:hypothetical protein
MLLNKRELKQYRVGKIRVYKVNGSFVRKDFLTDYCLGGHYLVYSWIPDYEVWLDDMQNNEELRYTLLHELSEIRGMLMGLSYEEAHSRYGLPSESRARHDGNLDEMIEEEMDKLGETIIDEPSHYNGHIHNNKRNHKLHTHTPRESNKLIGLR